MRTQQRTLQAMKLPRYVQKKRNSYQYCRKYPSDLLYLTPTKWFNYPLGVPETAGEAEIGRAAARATEAYELKCKTLVSSDPAAYRETEIDQLAAELLRRRRLQAGKFERVYVDPIVSSLEDKDQTDYQFDQHFFADLALPELEAVEDKARDGKRLSVFDHAAIRAREALTANVKRKPKTLSSLWDAYAEHKDIDRLSREGKRREGNWKRWIAVSGEHFISSVNSTEVIAKIHAALDDYVAERKSQVTGNSIKRELADILTCLRFGSKKFRFNWHIEPPTVRLSEAKRRAVLSVNEQQRLVRACLAARGEQVKVAVCVLLLQQGGLMVSEVSRLTVQNVQLTGKVPFVAIVGKTKKEARKRVVPIVFGNAMIRAGIVEVVDWLGRVTETTPSAAIKKFMVSVTGREDLTAHCLRHTWRHNAITAEAPDSVINDIGGWSGSRTVGVDALRYGSAGLTETRRIKILFEWNKKIFHFLKDVTEART